MTKYQIKPILKWVGGKRELVPIIREFYKNLHFEKYIEPFFGGGSVYIDIIETLNLNKEHDFIINDINTDLINLYKHIKSNPTEVIDYCEQLESDYYKYGYYHIRERFNGINKLGEYVIRYEGVQRSSSLMVLNRTCFNGLYRVNSKGLFNVPEGKYKNPKIVDKENLFQFSEILPKIENIKNVEFDQIDGINKGDLVYFDPPYHPLNETSYFTDYSGKFGESEQIRLRDYFQNLDNNGVFVILSNSSSEFIRNLYSNFRVYEVESRRNINSKGDKRGKINEFLIIGNSLKELLNII